MNVITAIDPIKIDIRYPNIFLAGGITNCPQWQDEVIEHLNILNGTIFNPRRKNFDITNSNDSKKQIKWEFDALIKTEIILFWFPKETLCPIVLFELGAALGRNSEQNKQGLYIGCHKEYQRRFDVIEQVKNVCDRTYGLQIEVTDTIEDLVKQIIYDCSWAKKL